MWSLKWQGRPCTLHSLMEWSSAFMLKRWSRDSHQKPFPRVVFIFCSPSRVPKGAVTENSDSSWCHLTGIYISYLPLVIGLVENQHLRVTLWCVGWAKWAAGPSLSIIILGRILCLVQWYVSRVRPLHPLIFAVWSLSNYWLNAKHCYS